MNTHGAKALTERICQSYINIILKSVQRGFVKTTTTNITKLTMASEFQKY